MSYFAYRDQQLHAETISLSRIAVTHIDIGSGLGNHKQKLLLEPGRSLVGNAGILLARVEYLKHGVHRNFAILDAAMNDLIRPAL